MGLGLVKNKNVKILAKRFSDGILKIEDVPGLFHSTDAWDINDIEMLTSSRSYQVLDHGRS
jgi:hypothetical protein